jgi:hypothetical protein
MCGILLPCLAQSGMAPDLSGLLYPALPRSARIQGTVRFLVASGEIMVVSGHPMLVQHAKDNLGKWAKGLPQEEPTFVNYNFRLLPERWTVREEPIGDDFDRFFLRLFHRPVTRTIRECVADTVVATSFKTLEGGTIEIQIDAVPSSCPETTTS